jgi:hypothetical protein
MTTVLKDIVITTEGPENFTQPLAADVLVK